MKPTRAFIILGCFLGALPAAAFEPKNHEPQGRLKIEIEPVRPVQENFDKYVQELAAEARREAESPPQKKDRLAELQAKAMNPTVLFRW